MELYGSLVNRMQENKRFCSKIEVGTYATVYSYSDRHAYEVVEVVDQDHVFVRQLDAKRADDNGMSECQYYTYTSNAANPIHELKFSTRFGWREITHYGQWYIDKFEKKELGWWWVDQALLSKVREAVAQGKTVKRYTGKWNISFGVADEYYDYSF